MKPTLPTLALLLLILPASAQEEPRKPVEPILRKAPTNAAWTVRTKRDFSNQENGWESAFDDGDSPSGNSVSGKTEVRHATRRKFEKNQALKTYHISTTWSDGDSQDDWIVMGRHVAERAGNRGLYVAGAESSLGQELASSDFPELSWIEMKHYRGIQTYKGSQVFVFEVPFNNKAMTIADHRYFNFAKQNNPNATPKDVFKPKYDKVVAYLDITTQLPVLYNDGTSLHRYSFSSPSSPIRPPQKIIDFLRKREDALRIRTATPAGPGGNK
jgi:hypothetical protein